MGVEGPELQKYNLYISGVRNLISTSSGPTINHLMRPNLIIHGVIISLGCRSVVTFVLFYVIDEGGAT